MFNAAIPLLVNPWICAAERLVIWSLDNPGMAVGVSAASCELLMAAICVPCSSPRSVAVIPPICVLVSAGNLGGGQSPELGGVHRADAGAVEALNLDGGQSPDLRGGQRGDHRCGKLIELCVAVRPLIWVVGQRGDRTGGQTVDLIGGQTADLSAGQGRQRRRAHRRDLPRGQAAQLTRGQCRQLSAGQRRQLRIGQGSDRRAAQTLQSAFW